MGWISVRLCFFLSWFLVLGFQTVRVLRNNLELQQIQKWLCLGLPMPLFETQRLFRSGHHWLDLFLTKYFQLDINKMIHVLYTIHFNSAKSSHNHQKKVWAPPNPLIQPTQPNPPSHHLRQRMWSVKNPWCRAKRYVFICTKIVQVLERSNAMSLPKGRIKSSETWNVKCHGLVDGWGGKWK